MRPSPQHEAVGTRAEVELRHGREWFRAVLQASRDGVVVEDGERIAFANEAAARLHGCGSAEEMIGLPVSTFQMPEEAERMSEYGRRRLRGEPAPAVYPFLGRRQDGTPVELEASVSTGEVGGRQYVITVLRDVAERSALEGQLRQAQKMEAVGRLAGGIAHDFNNLLTIINGYSELLLEGSSLEPEARRLLAEVNRAGERAAALTRQLLAFGRKQVLQTRVLDLNAVVADAGSMLRRLIGEDVELITRLGPAPGRVQADPAQLEQVIVNLVINARDAMPGGGTLTISTRHCRLPIEEGQRDFVLLEVTDTGAGMAEAVLARIFEPFFTTKEMGKGTGLGLAVVHGIVEQSGGFIDVTSLPGQGSTFRVYFPHVDAAVSVPVRKPVPAPTGSETVLLVEDEEGVRSLAGAILRQCGYTVLEARDGQEGLAVAVGSRERIDLLVSDVVMPHLGGPALAARLAALRPDLRVLYLSGYCADALSRRGVLEAGVDLLEKPFSPAELARKVREVLDRR